MNLLEEILLVIGALMFPYGIYEISKGDGELKTKLILILISVGLFTTEVILSFR